MHHGQQGLQGFSALNLSLHSWGLLGLWVLGNPILAVPSDVLEVIPTNQLKERAGLRRLLPWGISWHRGSRETGERVRFGNISKEEPLEFGD